MVFSGIVEEIGTVASISHANQVLLWDGTKGEGWILVVRCTRALEGAYIGASIAVNGTCLTVKAFDSSSFTVGLAPETIRRTNLGDLSTGSPVNLERALPADGRNSGHYVQGHVDGTGVIKAFWREGDSLWVRVGDVPPALMGGILPKGFIAVDGTSLTVCDVDPQAAAFTFMLIAHTQHHICLPTKVVGDRVNLEADVQGKYAAQAAGAAVARLEQAVASLEQQLAQAVEKLERRVAALELEGAPRPAR